MFCMRPVYRKKSRAGKTDRPGDEKQSVDPNDGFLDEGESSLFGYILETDQKDNGFRIIFSLIDPDQRTETSFEVECPFILQ